MSASISSAAPSRSDARSGGMVLAAAFLYIAAFASIGFFIIFFLAPLVYMLFESLKPPLMSGGDQDAFTLENYVTFLGDPFYQEILLRTLRIAALSSLVMLVCGYPVAYLLRIVSPRVRGRLLLLVVSPLLVSVVVRTYGWVIIMGKEGLLNSVLSGVGVTGRFVNDTHLFNETVVVIGVAHVFIPFMILAIYNSLQKFNLSLLRAASNLGAPPYRVFVEVTLPLTVPGIVAGLATVFPLAMGSFITVAVLGGPSVWVISMSAYQEAMALLNWQLAGAIGISLLVAVTVLVGLFGILMSRLTQEQTRP